MEKNKIFWVQINIDGKVLKGGFKQGSLNKEVDLRFT